VSLGPRWIFSLNLLPAHIDLYHISRIVRLACGAPQLTPRSCSPGHIMSHRGHEMVHPRGANPVPARRASLRIETPSGTRAETKGHTPFPAGRAPAPLAARKTGSGIPPLGAGPPRPAV